MTRKTPDPVDVYVGMRVRIARNHLTMSQTTLGKGLGITFQQVQKYEKGKNRIGSSRLQQIARLLRRPAAWFFDGAPGADALTLTEQPADPLLDLGATRDGMELARAFNAVVCPKMRAAIVALAQAADAGARV